MNQHIAFGSRASVPLEKLADLQGLKINYFEEPNLPLGGWEGVEIPDGTRIITLDRCGRVADDWQWAEQVDWSQTFAWAIQDLGTDVAVCASCHDLVRNDDLEINGWCKPCYDDYNDGEDAE